MEERRRDMRTLAITLRDRIVDLIKEEGLRPGDRLPSETELTARFKISRPALREALKLLEQDEVIVVEHGRGRFVSAVSAVQVERPITVFESATDLVRHYGYSPRNKVLSVSEVAADEEVAASLRLQAGDPVIRLERLRLQEDNPIMYCLDYVPRSIIRARLYDIDWSGSLIALLDSYEQRPRISAALVAAVALPEEVASRNDLRDFGPALLIKETCFNTLGVPVIYAIDFHRGSHFTFSLVRK